MPGISSHDRIPVEIRELWRVTFEHFVNSGKNHGVIQMTRENGTFLVWGPNRDHYTLPDVEQIAIANPPRVRGREIRIERVLQVETTGILESHIRNQPVSDTTLAVALREVERVVEASAAGVPAGQMPSTLITATS